MTQLRIVIFLLAQWQKYQECCSKRDASSNERIRDSSTFLMDSNSRST